MPLSHKSARRSMDTEGEGHVRGADESARGNKSAASKRPKKPSLVLACEWGQCAKEGSRTFDDMPAFLDHVTLHLRELAPDVMTLEQASKPREFLCEWHECGRDDLCASFLELTRHAYFHASHARLKSVGRALAEQQGVGVCAQDATHRNTIPEMPDRLNCAWDECQTLFDNPEVYYGHVAGHADSLPPGNNLEGGCVCAWTGCGVRVKSKHRLKEHLRSHTQEKIIACPTCGSLYSNATKFFDHIRRNTDPPSQHYQCTYCRKQYATKRLLREHVRHHVSHYKCSFCDMTCPSRSNLRTHIRYRHSEHRPFKCATCAYLAKSAVDLRRHEETHAEVWIECDADAHCTHRTRFGWEMSLHRRDMHQGEPRKYVCHMCGGKFRRGSRLTNHLRRKHELKWPAGHMRFRYTQQEDGYYRLQTIRYESADLTEQILHPPGSSLPPSPANSPIDHNHSPVDHTHSPVDHASSPADPTDFDSDDTSSEYRYELASDAAGDDDKDGIDSSNSAQGSSLAKQQSTENVSRGSKRSSRVSVAQKRKAPSSNDSPTREAKKLRPSRAAAARSDKRRLENKRRSSTAVPPASISMEPLAEQELEQDLNDDVDRNGYDVDTSAQQFGTVDIADLGFDALTGSLVYVQNPRTTVGQSRASFIDGNDEGGYGDAFSNWLHVDNNNEVSKDGDGLECDGGNELVSKGGDHEESSKNGNCEKINHDGSHEEDKNQDGDPAGDVLVDDSFSYNLEMLGYVAMNISGSGEGGIALGESGKNVVIQKSTSVDREVDDILQESGCVPEGCKNHQKVSETRSRDVTLGGISADSKKMQTAVEAGASEAEQAQVSCIETAKCRTGIFTDLLENSDKSEHARNHSVDSIKIEMMDEGNLISDVFKPQDVSLSALQAQQPAKSMDSVNASTQGKFVVLHIPPSWNVLDGSLRLFNEVDWSSARLVGELQYINEAPMSNQVHAGKAVVTLGSSSKSSEGAVEGSSGKDSVDPPGGLSSDGIVERAESCCVVENKEILDVIDAGEQWDLETQNAEGSVEGRSVDGAAVATRTLEFDGLVDDGGRMDSVKGVDDCCARISRSETTGTCDSVEAAKVCEDEDAIKNLCLCEEF